MDSKALKLTLPYKDYVKGKEKAYCLLYIDDLLLIGNDNTFLSTIIASLQRHFPIKDLGYLNYFLGLEVTWSSDGLYLTQSKYITELLEWANMYSNAISTPVCPK